MRTSRSCGLSSSTSSILRGSLGPWKTAAFILSAPCRRIMAARVSAIVSDAQARWRFSYYHTDSAFPAQPTGRLPRYALWKNHLARRAGDGDARDVRRGRIGARVKPRPRVAVEEPPVFARVHEFPRADIGRDQYIVGRKLGDCYFGAGLTVVEREKDFQDQLRIDRVIAPVHEYLGLRREM